MTVFHLLCVRVQKVICLIKKQIWKNFAFLFFWISNINKVHRITIKKTNLKSRSYLTDKHQLKIKIRFHMKQQICFNDIVNWHFRQNKLFYNGMVRNIYKIDREKCVYCLTSLHCVPFVMTYLSPDVLPPKIYQMTLELMYKCLRDTLQQSYIAPVNIWIKKKTQLYEELFFLFHFVFKNFKLTYLHQ